MASRRSSSPVGQEEGTDVRHRWGSGSELGQRHDVLKGDVCLRADVRHARVPGRAAVGTRHRDRGPGRRPAKNLHDDGITPDGLHYCFLMVDLGEVARVHLEEEESGVDANSRVLVLLKITLPSTPIYPVMISGHALFSSNLFYVAAPLQYMAPQFFAK